ncbi:2Fe-2S iron-sulfur cluster-binding protein [Corallincola spongiicola]|uniref:2Fe-2S iron-sulfur cluster binding domain-containing protein n=1 Tax=Corallincola spongiicola TaxID=2520508 RepID=A0ABY1WQN0_9GAMM|nr:2Fe-2S iron-sulfur cluster-binding protein [Corallincola spongiicola]TAA47027.1 2Fe-2S iron-sulfur cluster binding domain-containing protein [Corallincola spongiicola]
MAKVQFQDATIEINPDQSLLEALLSADKNIPNSCRSGLCQSCLVQSTDGHIPHPAQKGLSTAEIETKHLLACQCYPSTDMTVQLPDSGDRKIAATVVEKTQLPGQVIRLRLHAKLDYKPGQYVNLWRDESTIRSYSLASVPALEEHLEFHIRVQPEGRFSGWMQESLQVGDELQLQGPNGLCFYTAGDPAQPMLLAGIGTGLAPLWGIARDALKQGHSGPIHLYTGARNADNLYLHEEIAALAAAHDNLHYQVSLLETDTPSDAKTIDQLIASQHDALNGYRVFLCGSPQRVNKLRKLCFLKGASMQAIQCDLFQPAA